MNHYYSSIVPMEKPHVEGFYVPLISNKLARRLYRGDVLLDSTEHWLRVVDSDYSANRRAWNAPLTLKGSDPFGRANHRPPKYVSSSDQTDAAYALATILEWTRRAYGGEVHTVHQVIRGLSGRPSSAQKVLADVLQLYVGRMRSLYDRKTILAVTGWNEKKYERALERAPALESMYSDLTGRLGTAIAQVAAGEDSSSSPALPASQFKAEIEGEIEHLGGWQQEVREASATRRLGEVKT